MIDIETSGVNPFVHQALAIALVPMRAHSKPKVVYVRPAKITWSPFAEKNFEKFSGVWNRSAVAPKEACDEIEKYLSIEFNGENAVAVGHNIGFDVAFLRQLAYDGGRDQLANLSHRAIDTHTLLYVLHLKGVVPATALTSDGAFKFFDISVPEQLRHTALGDAEATKELIQKLLRNFLGETKS